MGLAATGIVFTILNFIFSLIPLIILILIIRVIRVIPIIVRNLKAQTKLLSEMAKANGVNPDLVENIKSEAKIND